MKLVHQISLHGDDWDSVVKAFNGKKTKNECILQFLQLPIKENVHFKLIDIKNNSDFYVKNDTKIGNLNETNSSLKKELESVNDLSNPIIAQIVFFSKMFDKFVDAERSENEEFSNKPIETIKETIYRTYSKAKDNATELLNKEKTNVRKILDLLIFTQMKKIEMKLEYFKEFEKLMEFDSVQLKSMESQVIQDRIRLAMKRNELMSQASKLKQISESLDQPKTNSYLEGASMGNHQQKGMSDCNGKNGYESMYIDQEVRVKDKQQETNYMQIDSNDAHEKLGKITSEIKAIDIVDSKIIKME